MNQRLFRIMGVIGILFVLFALSRQESLATEEVFVIVKVVPGTDIAQLESDFGMVLLNSIEVLSLYRFQGFGTNLSAELASDGRVLAADVETDLESRPNFEAPPGSIDAYIRYIDAHIRYIDAHIRYIDAHIRYIDAHIRYIDAHVGEYDDNDVEIGAPYRGQPSAINTRIDQALDIATGENVIVAVLDSGVDMDHPLLEDNIIPGYDFVDGDADPSEVSDGIDNDGDGHIDEASGHGTHVAGVVNLVAPSAQIMPLRIFDSEGHGTYFDAAAAIVYAVDNGAQVINLSGNGEDDLAILKDAVDYAWANGVIIVSAAGVNQINYPGRYDNVISVAAADDNDYRTDFSQYQNESPTVYAPGMDIFSSYLDGNLAEWTGNSMATPFVAGEVALMLSTGSCDANCTFAGVSETGRPLADAPTKRLDVFDAVSWAATAPQTRVKVQYQQADDIPSDPNIKPYLKIVNLGNSLPLDELTMRYWFDEQAPAYEFNCDYAQIGCEAVTAVFSQTVSGQEYAEIQFTNAGTLYGGHGEIDSGDVQIRFNASDWRLLDESDDYSYSLEPEFVDWEKVTLYHNGTLVWGVEPEGQAADMSWYEVYSSSQSNAAPPPQNAPTTTPTISAQYYTHETTAVTNQLRPHLMLVNQGDEEIPLADLTVRYWFSDAAAAQAACDYAVINCSNLTSSFGTNYAEFGFTNSAGTLGANSTSGTIKLRIHKTDWSLFDQSIHHSFNPAMTTYTDWEKVTIYHNGTLIWGVEP